MALQVKVLQVYVDGELVSPQSGYLIRRAPGHAHYDYGQTLSFLPPRSSGGGGEGLTDHHSTAESNSQADPQLPRGCIQDNNIIIILKASFLGLFPHTTCEWGLHIYSD